MQSKEAVLLNLNLSLEKINDFINSDSVQQIGDKGFAEKREAADAALEFIKLNFPMLLDDSSCRMKEPSVTGNQEMDICRHREPSVTAGESDSSCRMKEPSVTMN